ncbi:hypothetical protein GS429_14855 [Natronorubrum sp. JWXQ-INN-674]|uniref:Uncharacterized protein n=1 Tax=Natronorubrum halalkaliphilum TaxID=2691917 RepID=A0A6B0VRB0_9EURY|nr:hypothetical protein [Natronorubrum halalkaliphilum]MXV63322.1 hypothetical protein [Natronorubrum halalkaliphilum]
MKLDIVLELYKRSHWSPYSVAIDNLETFSDAYDDEESDELIAEIVDESDAVEYTNRQQTRIQLATRAKPQDYIDELNEQNDWYA